MYSVGIYEPPAGKTTDLIRDRLAELGGGPSVVITRGDKLDCFAGRYDLFVVAPGEMRDDLEGPDIPCRVMLVPGSVPIGAIARIRSRWAVSYGLSAKDSITVSSLERDCAVLALQRELVTLEENVVEQQEIPIRFPCKSGSERVMAAYGSLLILGITPEELAETIHTQQEVEE